MANTTDLVRTKCRGCGFEADNDGDEWDVAEHPTLGRVTRCPECGSTDTTTL